MHQHRCCHTLVETFSGVSCLITILVLQGLVFEQTFTASHGNACSPEVKCPNCPPGYQHNQTCEDGQFSQVGCIPCIQGKTYRTFEEFKVSDNTCKTCLDCNLFNRQTKFKCRTVADAVCGECMDGYSDNGQMTFGGLPTECKTIPPVNKVEELAICLAVVCGALLVTNIYLLGSSFHKLALPSGASSSDRISPLIPLSVSAMEGAPESEPRVRDREISGKKNQLSGSRLQNHSGFTMDSNINFTITWCPSQFGFPHSSPERHHKEPQRTNDTTDFFSELESAMIQPVQESIDVYPIQVTEQHSLSPSLNSCRY